MREMKFEFRGRQMTIREICEAAGKPTTDKYLNRIRMRIVRRGWSVERAVSEPPMSPAARGKANAVNPLCRIPYVGREAR